jgi:DNA-binding XRE family transcriptional regulator
MPRGRRINWERREQMAALYDQGLSFDEVAQELGLTREWVRKCLAHDRPNRHKLQCRDCETVIISPTATGHQRPVLCRDCVLRQREISFAEALHSLRVNAGLSQASLAEAVGMTQTQIALYELGRFEPRWSEAVQLFAILGATWALQPTSARKARKEA